MQVFACDQDVVNYEYRLRLEDMARWYPCVVEGLGLGAYTAQGWTAKGNAWLGPHGGSGCWWKPHGWSCEDYAAAARDEDGRAQPVALDTGVDVTLRDYHDTGASRSWQRYYSHEPADLLYHLYRRDFEAFGYERAIIEPAAGAGGQPVGAGFAQQPEQQQPQQQAWGVEAPQAQQQQQQQQGGVMPADTAQAAVAVTGLPDLGVRAATETWPRPTGVQAVPSVQAVQAAVVAGGGNVEFVPRAPLTPIVGATEQDAWRGDAHATADEAQFQSDEADAQMATDDAQYQDDEADWRGDGVGVDGDDFNEVGAGGGSEAAQSARDVGDT